LVPHGPEPPDRRVDVVPGAVVGAPVAFVAVAFGLLTVPATVVDTGVVVAVGAVRGAPGLTVASVVDALVFDRANAFLWLLPHAATEIAKPVIAITAEGGMALRSRAIVDIVVHHAAPNRSRLSQAAIPLPSARAIRWDGARW